MDEARAVRLVIDVLHVPGGGLAGQISPADAPPVAFEGWLELLQALERLTAAPDVSVARAPVSARSWLGARLRHRRPRPP